MTANTPKRLLALDILRGITIAGMILVNNPGSWGHVYTPLEHAAFNGLTPTDLVFPFFMFIMGISTYISLRKYNFTYSHATLRKIVKRTVVIFCIGLFLNLPAKSVFTHHLNFEELRYLGVMQRLAIGYGVTSPVAITVKHKYFPAIILVTLAVYFLLLAMGDGFNLSATNIVARFDVWALGTSHMYHDGGMAFDPEGLLSTLPAVCHVMVGFYCGKLLFSAKDNDEKIQRLFLVGTILTFAGFLLSYGCPINKKVWSPTFVITTCGLASSFLALLIRIIDIKGYQGWCVFFRSFGVNPLFIYVFAEIMGILLGATGASVFIYEKVLVPVLGNYPGSLAYALLYVLFCWSIVHILYKKGIYVKI
ncbi:heparan-alpha-glucosaminide N-acetyltransferase domain-containing protein [Phocaeicola vulgatus]|nr:heparan-alpha-glucosaminide N-acetyltransferase domain-containing protein [Phocaeicola vulgatus]